MFTPKEGLVMTAAIDAGFAGLRTLPEYPGKLVEAFAHLRQAFAQDARGRERISAEAVHDGIKNGFCRYFQSACPQL